MLHNHLGQMHLINMDSVEKVVFPCWTFDTYHKGAKVEIQNMGINLHKKTKDGFKFDHAS
jgi:hypothetical protein